MKRRTLLLCLLFSFNFQLPAEVDPHPGHPGHPDKSEWRTVSSLAELATYAVRDGVKVRMIPGTYVLEEAESHHFISFSGKGSHYDLRGVIIRVDTELFSRFGRPRGLNDFYCVIDLSGDDILFEGATIETFGDRPGLQSKNKILNITGSRVVVKNLDITTSGSSPWGYGSFFGISGGDVRKMNGIRVGWPAQGVRIIDCRVHMRAMGHAIFVQGATDTLIESCHVDGLLRSTNEILAEGSGYAYERNFKASGAHYIEGVTVGPEGEILPGEIVSLSEDGIRLYGQYNGIRTGPTTIRNCTVRGMRRGICTGLGQGSDRVINCKVTDSVAAAFNIGSGDILENCRADAKYAEALSCPYPNSKNARVELEILDSRDGMANDLLATINGQGHAIRIHTQQADFVPASMLIALGTRRGYAFYQNPVKAPEQLSLQNETRAKVINDLPGKDE
jgi:hypothetical protein